MLRAGTIFLKRNGSRLDAKGNFTYRPKVKKNEMIVGSDTIHGPKQTVQVPYIEGEITDRSDLNLTELFSAIDETITLELANGKTFVLRKAMYAGEATCQTEEGNVSVRWEGQDGEEILP